MSDLMDQRGKGQPNQVSNGPGRDKEEKFDAYLQQPQTSYGPGTMSSPGVAENSFLPNYYTAPFPYAVGQGMNDGAWSNGGEQPMFSMNTYDYNGIFNSFGFPPYGWDYTGANDYWGSVGQGRKDTRQYAETDAYYQPEMMTGDPYMMNGDLDHDITSVDQGLKGMSLGNDKNMVVENGPSDMGMDNGNVTGSVAPQMQTMSSAPKKTSWAAIASQPARPQPMKRLIPRAPVNPNKPHNMDIGTWDNSRGGSGMGAKQPPPQRQTWTAPRRQMTSTNSYNSNVGGTAANHNQSNSNGTSGYNNTTPAAPPAKNPVLDKLRSANMYNPKEFNLNPKGARYFIIKSYSEDDIHRSIKYSIWCSTEHGNKRLDSAYREREGKGPLYLFFSVNSSGHFCGMAQMMSAVDYNSTSGVWCQDKWKGVFEVKWIYVKDIPNGSLRHIRLENNENKPVTNSRDTQEVPPEKGKQVLKILHNYHHTTSIFDDFVHYEKRQEEDQIKEPAPSGPSGPNGPSPNSSSRPQGQQGQGQGPPQGQGQGQGNPQKERPDRRPRQN